MGGLTQPINVSEPLAMRHNVAALAERCALDVSGLVVAARKARARAHPAIDMIAPHSRAPPSRPQNSTVVVIGGAKMGEY